MSSTTRFSPALPSLGERPALWLRLRDLAGGALLIAVLLALWTAAWAAIAGPLFPVEEAGTRALLSLAGR